MKKIFLVAAVLSAALSLNAQTINDPNVQARDVKGFHSIKISSAFDLYLDQSGQESVAVSASNVEFRDRIRTEVNNGVLKIWFDDKDKWMTWKNSNKRLRAYVSVRELKRLDASGACDVLVQGLIKSDKLELGFSGASDFKGRIEVNNLVIDQSGASDMTISGSAKSAKIDLSGASALKAYDLMSESCSAEASGASDVKISVEKELVAKASGASSINYKGEASVRELNSSGASHIRKKG